ncbi:MAG TPA: FAD-dependent oxidoreductase [Aestuariivirgaceae bacterium]|jgi:glycine/D-amino acid oxidase-like deaminating enzyme/nitrite reductase/ring-hydroxylating ferredoxin subunit
MNASREHSKSLWTAVSPVAAPPLSSALSVDVAIVGSGIAGTSVAYELSEHGLKVALIDRGQLGGGMTSRTSAHLTFQSDDLYQEVVSRHGLRKARLHYESQRAAVDRIEAVQKAERIACDFKRVDGVLGLAEGTDLKVLEDELDACHRIGFKEVKFARNEKLAHLKTSHGLSFPRQARFHPLKYLVGVHKKLRTQGAVLHADTAVVDIKEKGRSVELKTENGSKIHAAAAVVATNSPIEPKVAIHTKQAPYRTYVFAADVPRESVGDALYWDTADPYHYVRLQPERHNDILIVGGEDHRTGESDDAAARFGKLERWARERFPGMGKITHRWSGQVLEPVDHVAFIGKSPGRSNIYVATGDSGQGLTHGVVAGMLISELIVKGSSRWAALHDPSRKSVNALGEYVEENVAAVKNLMEYVTPGELKSTRSCKRGQGGILRKGLRKLAVSRDMRGKLHVVSATCTHVGCLVHWNSFEQCWDCPCHGSHFASDGVVLNAPAAVGLAKPK